MAKETRDAAQERAETLAEKAKAEAQSALDYGRDKAQAKAEEAQHGAAHEAQETAEALRAAGERFDQGDFRRQAATQLADGLGDIAESIRGKDLADIPDDLRRFARRNPAMFYGGAALLGFALARMAVASERKRDEDEAWDDDWNDDWDGARRAAPAPTQPAMATPAPAGSASGPASSAPAAGAPATPPMSPSVHPVKEGGAS
ncbi:hypothetical protein DXV76_10955 [Rhodobacteraceae bacterium CCMM004]|nr:hypothetical protein DXV76_10955 [Rhodobacteraceae bacterium CCMM004]